MSLKRAVDSRQAPAPDQKLAKTAILPTRGEMRPKKGPFLWMSKYIYLRCEICILLQKDLGDFYVIII